MQPEIDLFGLEIKAFGLALGVGFLLAGTVLAHRLRELGKSPDWAYEMIFAALVGGIVGARLWWFLDNLDEAREDGVLSALFGGSGLTWYGGAIGGAITVLLWARRKGMFNLSLLDLCAPGLALGYAVGRVGCQLAGDGDYGKTWDGPWAMAYPNGTVPTDQEVHPTPIYETLAMGSAAVVLWHLRDRFAPGRLFALYLIIAGLERFLIEFIRRNPGAAGGLTTAQLVSLVMLVAGAVWFVRTRGNPSPAARS